MNKATLAVYAGPGEGEPLYRRAADVFGLPDWQLVWSAACAATLDVIGAEAFPALRFALVAEEGTGLYGCMVQEVRDRKARGAIVNSDGAATILVSAPEQDPIAELFSDLVQIVKALPGNTRLRVYGTPIDTVVDTTAATLTAVLAGVIRDAARSERELPQAGGS